MVARLTRRQGGEAVFLLLQRAGWDASGRLVAMGLIKDTVINLGMGIGIGTSILVTNISFPFDHAGKGRDVLLLRTNSEALRVFGRRQPNCPFRPVAASWTCSWGGVKEQHGPHTPLNACGNGNRALLLCESEYKTTGPQPMAVMTCILCGVGLLSRPSESARTPTHSKHLSGLLFPLTPGRICVQSASSR